MEFSASTYQSVIDRMRREVPRVENDSEVPDVKYPGEQFNSKVEEGNYDSSSGNGEGGVRDYESYGLV